MFEFNRLRLILNENFWYKIYYVVNYFNINQINLKNKKLISWTGNKETIQKREQIFGRAWLILFSKHPAWKKEQENKEGTSIKMINIWFLVWIIYLLQTTNYIIHLFESYNVYISSTYFKSSNRKSKPGNGKKRPLFRYIKNQHRK